MTSWRLNGQVRLADPKELAFLGAESSPSFVRAPEDPVGAADIPPLGLRQRDRCAERLIRTLKENLLWLRRFDTIEELRQLALAFKERYHQTWIVERHGSKAR